MIHGCVGLLAPDLPGRLGAWLIMLKLCTFLGSGLLSWLFWWGAEALGGSFFTAFLISGVGALLGCWVGWWIYQRYLS